MKIKLMHELAQVPTRNTPWDAGADLYAVERVEIARGKWALVDTGVSIELPDGYVGYVCPRSGLAFKSGLTVFNAPGVIDSGYRGSIKVNLINLDMGKNWTVVKPGDRIAQLVVQQCYFPDFELVENLSLSARGDNGHGSSGN